MQSQSGLPTEFRASLGHSEILSQNYNSNKNNKANTSHQNTRIMCHSTINLDYNMQQKIINLYEELS